jgi:hypothetical protein
MQLSVDVPQPAHLKAGSAEPSHPWILGLIARDDSPRATPAGSTYSFLAECECPDDCMRDHENE